MLMPLAMKVDSPQSFTTFLGECDRHIKRECIGYRTDQLLDSMSAWLSSNDHAPKFLTAEILANPWKTAAVLIVVGIEYD